MSVGLIVTHQDSPWNAECTLDELLDYEVTPYSHLYARNHSKKPPTIAHSEYRLSISGLVDQELSLSLHDLKAFPKVTMDVAMQCAGLRRDEMNHIKDTEGVGWSSCAVSNCSYTGVLLSTVLESVTMATGATFVLFEAHNVPCDEDDYYGSSIPISMIQTHDALLAYGLNGENLPDTHGGPCRVVIPGVYGARSVKWLDTIKFSTGESECFYQQRDYKVLPEHIVSREQANRENAWKNISPMTEIIPESVISRDREGTMLRGYALSSSRIKKVEVSFDDKATWVDAAITYQSGQWSWTLFEIEAPVKAEGCAVYSRATDAKGQVQPEYTPWNLRGVGYNAYGKCNL